MTAKGYFCTFTGRKMGVVAKEIPMNFVKACSLPMAFDCIEDYTYKIIQKKRSGLHHVYYLKEIIVLIRLKSSLVSLC